MCRWIYWSDILVNGPALGPKWDIYKLTNIGIWSPILCGMNKTVLSLETTCYLFFIVGNGLMVSKIYSGNNHPPSLCCWGSAGCLVFPFESHWPWKRLFTTLPLTYVHMHIPHYSKSHGPFSELNPFGPVLASSFPPFHCTDSLDFLKLFHKVNTFPSSQPF
jgi:hypothetical protein